MKKNSQKYKAFSLLEMMIAMFILVVVVMASVSSFASMNSLRKKIRDEQKNLENASGIIQQMAKSLRMNTAAKDYNSQGLKRIDYYGSSEGICISYRFSGGKLQKATADPLQNNEVDDPKSCIGESGAVSYSYEDMDVQGINDMNLSVRQTAEGVAGRAVITIKVDNNWLEDSVSFRDYSYL